MRSLREGWGVELAAAASTPHWRPAYGCCRLVVERTLYRPAHCLDTFRQLDHGAGFPELLAAMTQHH
eukprot:7264122-Heterocapsa_arctica.AAC.1